MTVTINGTTGIAGVDGSAATPAVQGVDTNTGVFYGTDIVAISTGGTERVRVNASGNVGIGTASPSGPLNVVSASGSGLAIAINGRSSDNTGAMYLYANDGTTQQATIIATASEFRHSSVPAAAVQTFYTNAAERMRIDASGNLLVGITTSDARLNVKGSGTASGTFTTKMANSAGTIGFQIRDDGYVGSPMIYAQTNANGANVTITSDGYIYRSTSSLKYKRDVEDATHGLAEVMQIRPVTYKGKSESDNEKILGGLIAEEVHAAGLTEFVQYAEDGSPDALAYGNMVSLCIKAIQEQQAMITALTARITALEVTP